jgi:GTP-binding protein Era
MDQANKKTKSLSLCIIGKPNAGKSTLLNYLIGEKLSIVTPKVQTTRSVITGIVTIEDTQLIILDTPGIFDAKRNMERAMVRCAWSSLRSVDLVVVIIDSSQKLDDYTRTIIDRVLETKQRIIFLLNKIDLNSRYYSENLALIENMVPAATIFNISALSGNGINYFLEYIKHLAKNSPWLYEADDMTTLPARFIACEITREQLFLQLNEELPYNLVVKCEHWENYDNGSIKIHQQIIVQKESHKMIILGDKGKKIKAVGSAARINIEKFLGTKVHLFLFVKVVPDILTHWSTEDREGS